MMCVQAAGAKTASGMKPDSEQQIGHCHSLLFNALILSLKIPS